METQIPPHLSAAESPSSVAIDGSLSIHLPLSDDDSDNITSGTRTGSDFEEISQAVAQNLPEAIKLLQDRLTISIKQWQTRLLQRQRQHNEPKTTIESEVTNVQKSFCSFRNSNAVEESSKRESGGDFPKAPELDSSPPHFLCQTCFVLTPSEEAKGDSWM